MAGFILWRKSDRSMRLLTILLLYGLLNSLALVYLALQNTNNMFLVHLYILISYLFIALLFSYWLNHLPALLIRWSILAFIILYIIMVFLGYEDLTLPNEFSMSIRSILVAFITFYALYFTLRDHSDFPIYHDERFWISIGTFITCSGAALVYAAIPVYITYPLWLIHCILVIIGNIAYFAGYLCLRRLTISGY